MNKRYITLVIVLVGLTALGVWRWWLPSRQAGQFVARQNRVHEAIGFALGQELAKRFPSGGDVLVVLPGLPAKEPVKGVDAARLRGLRAGCGTTPLKAALVSHPTAADQQRLAAQSEWQENGVPAAKLREWFDAHAGAVGLVAFVPVEVGPELPPLFLSSQPLVATEAWLKLVEPGKLAAVVVTAQPVNWEQVSVQDPLPKLFQQSFQLIGPENVEAARSRLLRGR